MVWEFKNAVCDFNNMLVSQVDRLECVRDNKYLTCPKSKCNF